ncbi:unnamed protein product [Linum trigynum]|uniref:Uncharacterized protein n=1 Tax=Linum trigynum TaxID=586398 RepID=A0AAV2CR04_9ROSI
MSQTNRAPILKEFEDEVLCKAWMKFQRMVWMKFQRMVLSAIINQGLSLGGKLESYMLLKDGKFRVAMGH